MNRRRTYARHAMAPRARFEVHVIAALAAVAGMLAITVGVVIGLVIIQVTS